MSRPRTRVKRNRYTSPIGGEGASVGAAGARLGRVCESGGSGEAGVGGGEGGGMIDQKRP